MQGVWGSGGGFEGDLVAEGLEFADVVMLLAVEVDPGVVVVGSEVAKVGVVVAEQVPGDDQDGSADRDNGSFLAASTRDPAVPLAQEGIGAPRVDSGVAQNPRQVAVPCPVAPLPFLRPADSLTPGAYLAQDERWAGVGKRVMSTPISAMITAAAVAPIPGISARRATACAKGTNSCSVRCCTASMSALSAGFRSEARGCCRPVMAIWPAVN